jgi:sigma-B regulation protein RsbQ
MAVLASLREPHRFRQLVLVAATPYFLQDPATGYDGGFSDADMTEVAGALDSNYFTWAEAMAPVIMGTPDSPELGEDLTGAFCRVDPDIARQLLGIMFSTDFRPLLPRVTVPTVVLQCRADAMVPAPVAGYLRDHIVDCTLVQLQALGHCPHVSAPEETAAAIRAHLLT